MQALDLMSEYVAHLRALYMVHQNAHWESKGSSFYGNHLLFQRLYTAVQELTDEAAEKCIGVYGELKHIDTQSIVDKYQDMDFVEASLEAEKDFQALADATYKELKSGSVLTLGVDDMIMSHVSKSEVHTYLLQQLLG